MLLSNDLAFGMKLYNAAYIEANWIRNFIAPLHIGPKIRCHIDIHIVYELCYYIVCAPFPRNSFTAISSFTLLDLLCRATSLNCSEGMALLGLLRGVCEKTTLVLLSGRS